MGGFSVIIRTQHEWNPDNVIQQNKVETPLTMQHIRGSIDHTDELSFVLTVKTQILNLLKFSFVKLIIS